VRTTQAAVRTLDLENKVQADMVKRTLEAQAKRQGRAELAAVLGVVAGQFRATFEDRIDLLKNPLVGAGVSYAPLLALSPGMPGSGPSKYLRDPRLIGLAAIGGILAADKLTRPRAAVVTRVVITGVPQIPEGATVIFVADAFDDKGKNLPEVATWTSSDTNVAKVDSATGAVTGENPGFAVITATMAGVVARTGVAVVAVQGDGQVLEGVAAAESGGRTPGRRGQGGS
jgi:hypothetical protein